MDSDFRVIDFDLVDDRAQIGAAEGYGTASDIFAHQVGEGGNLFFGYPRFRAQFGKGAVERRLGLIALCLKRRNTILQREVSEVRDAIFDGLIQARQAALCVRNLVLQGGHAERMIIGSRGLPFEQAAEDGAHAVRGKKRFAEAFGDKSIEFIHGN